MPVFLRAPEYSAAFVCCCSCLQLLREQSARMKQQAAIADKRLKASEARMAVLEGQRATLTTNLQVFLSPCIQKRSATADPWVALHLHGAHDAFGQCSNLKSQISKQKSDCITGCRHARSDLLNMVHALMSSITARCRTPTKQSVGM